MSTKGPSSPGKNNLILAAQKLPQLEQKKREIISFGAQSLIISDGHRHVLLVTRYTVAKKIELLKSKIDPQKNSLIEIPELVGTDSNILLLLASNPNPSKRELNAIKKSLGLPSPELLTQNIVYRLPRHDGNLEMLNKIRFKDDSIIKLEETLYSTIDELHDAGLTHGDISKRNILVSGEYPDLTFRLCDWGSIEKISDATQDKDFRHIARVIGQVKEMLAKKERFKEKTQSSKLLSDIFSDKAAKMGLSPSKPVDPTLTKENPPTPSQKTKLNLLGKLLASDSTQEQPETANKNEETRSQQLLLNQFNSISPSKISLRLVKKETSGEQKNKNVPFL